MRSTIELAREAGADFSWLVSGARIDAGWGAREPVVLQCALGARRRGWPQRTCWPLDIFPAPLL